MHAYKNILVVRTDRIGDVVLTTPAIKALRKKFPQSRITVLLSPATKVLLEGAPFINEILLDDKRKGILGYLRLIFLLRKKKFDLVIVFHTKKRSNALCFLAGIPKRLGYKNNKWGGLLNMPVLDDRAQGFKHEIQYCLDLLQAIGVHEHVSDCWVTRHQEEEKWAIDFLVQNKITPQDKIIAIHPGASDPAKCWPEYRFVELLKGLHLKYKCKILLLGTKETQERAHTIESQLSFPVINLTGQTSLKQFVSILNHCHILISNDSGPVHVAAALEIGVIAVFTRNQPGINIERWKPLGIRSIALSPSPNSDVSFVKSKAMSPKYLDTITAPQVLEAVDALFKLC